MNNEKIIRYFNMDKKFDNFIILLMSGMDLGISTVYFLGMLFEIVPMTTTTVIVGVVGIVLDILLMLCSKFITNPAMEYPMLFFLSLLSMVKQIINAYFSYGTESTLKGISLGPEYLAITVILVSFALIVLREKIIALKLLKSYTVEEAREMLSNRKINKWVFPVAVLPGGTLLLYRLLRNQVNFSITFCCWGLASVSLFFVLITGYNLVVAIYYRLFQICKNNQTV